LYRRRRRLSDRRRRRHPLPALANLPTASMLSSLGPPIVVVVVVPAIPLPSPQSRALTAPVARRLPPRGSSSSDRPLATRLRTCLAAIPASVATHPPSPLLASPGEEPSFVCGKGGRRGGSAVAIILRPTMMMLRNVVRVWESFWLGMCDTDGRFHHCFASRTKYVDKGPT
jgi:hypothetical protein